MFKILYSLPVNYQLIHFKFSYLNFIYNCTFTDFTVCYRLFGGLYGLFKDLLYNLVKTLYLLICEYKNYSLRLIILNNSRFHYFYLLKFYSFLNFLHGQNLKLNIYFQNLKYQPKFHFRKYFKFTFLFINKK